MQSVSVAIGVLIACLAVNACAEELNITASGKSQTFNGFWEDYERCKARQEFTPVRGEYETQEEYRRRVEQLRVGCDTLRRVESAVIDVPVALNYDADAGRFLFELPTDKGMRIQYGALVRDDFPAVLNHLPRDRWHIDDPTPKASAYKECTLRDAKPNSQFINKIEPCRTDSWRGCMTYYKQGEEVSWYRDKDTFFISDVTFYAYAAIAQARRVRDMEKDLIYRIEGVLVVPEQSFQAQRVEIINRKTGEQLVSLSP
ncbi:MAG: hypothetical protein HZB57_13510 [Gammaproteobacteria bacterium]|nr:hypothetical protein [Gammaproteobacteria bacterium]